MDPWLYLLMAFVLVLANGFFIAAEGALGKSKGLHPSSPQERKGLRHRMADHALDHLDRYLVITQLGITAASLGLGWLGASAPARLMQPLFSRMGWESTTFSYGVLLLFTFGLLAILHATVGVAIPKTLAVKYARSVAPWLVPPLVLLSKPLKPVAWTVYTLSRGLLRWFGMQPATAEDLHATEEVRIMLAESQKSGGISEDEKELVENVFEMAERTVRQIMTPRADIAFLSTTDPMERTLKIAHQFRYTRYPLCEGNLDRIVGMVHIKELFVVVQDGLKVGDVKSIKREVLFVPETAPVKSLLREFQQKHAQMAIVIDEYGGTTGLVTLEDILEEIVGDIRDELDKPAPLKFQPLADGRYIVQANALLEEVSRELDIGIEDHENDTIGGHVVTRLGRLAQPGDAVVVGPFEVRVLRVEGRRVNTLEFIPRPDLRAEGS